MGVLHFFKNKMRQFKKTDMLKIISDLAIPDIQNMNEFDESLSYKPGEKVFYYDKDEDRYVILIATKDIEPGEIKLDDWKESTNPNLTSSMTVIDSNLVQRTYSTITTVPNQKTVLIPKLDYSHLSDTFLISINTSLVTDDNYRVDESAKTITFIEGSNYDNLVANTQIDFIFFSTLKRKVRTSMEHIVSIPSESAKPFEYVIKAEDIDLSTNSVSFTIDPEIFSPSTNSILVFVEGLLLTRGVHFKVVGNKVSLSFLLPEDSTVTYIIQRIDSATGEYGEILPIASMQQALEGVDNHSIMTPLKVSEKIKSFLEFASDKEAINPNITDKIMTPHSTKVAIDEYTRNAIDEILKETLVLDITCTDGSTVIGQYVTIKNLTDDRRSSTRKINARFMRAFIEPGDSYTVSVNAKFGYITPKPVTFGPAVKGRKQTCTMMYVNK